jgi:hypothetical protein
MKLKSSTITLTLLLFVTPFLKSVQAQNPNASNVSNPIVNTTVNDAPFDTTTTKDYIIANNAIQFAKKQGKIYESIHDDKLASLPIGISKIINGNRYVVFIDSAHYNDNAYLSVYTEFALPGTDVQLIFGIKNISFTNTNLKFTANTRLELLRSESIRISDNVTLQLAAGGKNYIDWDCNGFKAISLEGTFKFKNTFLIPDGNSNPNATVNATFKLYATDFSNMLAGISITPFQIKGLKGFSFEVQEAMVDLSDDANPSGMSLSSLEMDEFDGNQNLWRGFYLKKLKITLPPMFSKQNGDRPSVEATNLRIDDNGVTGTFSALNILKLGDADAGGWPISIDRLDIQLIQSKIRGGGIGGELNVGFLGDKPLRYLARVTEKDGSTWYNFNVMLQDTVKFNTFLGSITLQPTSIITLDKINDSIVGSATLHGRVDISQKLLKAPGIIFQDVELSTQRPFIRRGVFSVDGNINCKIAGYGIQFQRLTLGIQKGLLALASNVKLDLMNSGDNGFSAEADITVTANQEETKYTTYIGKTPVERTRTKWKFDKVKVGGIALDVKVSAFRIRGLIKIYDDHPVYGDGFQGALSIKIPSMPQDFKANGYFGTKTDSAGTFKYYHVDVKIPFGPSGIPLFPGISMYSMTGGLSYCMERPNDFDPFVIANNIKNQGGERFEIDTAGSTKMVESFLTYIPSRKSGYGFLAGVTIGTTGTTSLFNADLMFEVMLATGGGLRYVQFDGSMYFLSGLDKRGSSIKDETGTAAIFAQAKIRYDNEAHSLHGVIKTYLNFPGKSLTGIGERGLAGECQFHFDNHNWWIYIGRPSQMFGVSVLQLAQAKFYMQVGTKTEDMPPLPPEVGDILGESNLNFMEKENAMSTGKGFGFGVHFNMAFGIGNEPGSKSFLYAFLKVGAGVDVLLRDYGTARCKGSGELGVNGWYASGQAYAFLEGRVGIRVSVFKKRREFDIARVGAAAVLQAKLPNPSWFRGIMGIKYSVLGGLIKGNAKVKFELGTQCEIIGNKEIEIQIIKDFLPDSSATNVSVFASPQASFNMAVEKPFSMMNNEDVVTTYRVKLQSFTFEANNKPIAGEINLTPEKEAVNFVSNEVLPPNNNIKGKVTLFVEKENGIGNWIKVLENGAPMTESKSVTFKTGEAPNNIPAANIAYTYPIHKQYNFFAKEYNTGYITLKQGQAYLFNPSSGTGNDAIDWKYTAHFETVNGEALDVPLTYDAAKRTVAFSFPEAMKNNMVYNLGIVKTPSNGGNAASNVVQNTTTTIEEEGDTTSVTTTSLRGMALSENAVLLYQLAFRSSKFNSFKDKIAAQRNTQNLFDISTNIQPVIGKRYDTDEAFDLHDLEGTNASGKPLVQIVAAENNAWLQNKVSPLLYDPYEALSSLGITTNRQTDYFGIKPIKAVKVHNNDVASFELTEPEMGEALLAGKTSSIRYMYYVNIISNSDHADMRNKAVNNYINGAAAPEVVRNLMLNVFPELEAGNGYNIKINYVLPGTGIISSTVDDIIMYR